MKTYSCIIESRLANVSRRFRPANYELQNINRVYASAKEARKEYDLSRCNYRLEDEDGNVVALHENARVDRFGRRLYSLSFYGEEAQNRYNECW